MQTVLRVAQAGSTSHFQFLGLSQSATGASTCIFNALGRLPLQVDLALSSAMCASPSSGLFEGASCDLARIHHSKEHMLASRTANMPGPVPRWGNGTLSALPSEASPSCLEAR